MVKKPYQRDPDGTRLNFAGINIVLPPDQMPVNKYPYAQNVRRYLQGRIVSRATQDSSVETLPYAVHSLRRLNDSTPLGPPAGFILVAGASTNLYANTTQVDSGLSGNPISLMPFRPNASVQPWMYVGDSLKMDKVRSDGTCYRAGIAEPQVAPGVMGVAASTVLSLLGPVTVTYYNNLASQHSTAMSNFIFKNPSDTGAAGPLLSSIIASGVTTGNSLLFDSPLNPPTVTGSPSTPMAWTTYATYEGTVTTAGVNVTWDSGQQFTGLVAGQNITINAVQYTIAASPAPTNTTLSLTASAGAQVGVTYQAVAISGVTPIFQPALEGEGYADFTLVITGTFYVPAAGTYIIGLSSKDEVIWGIGGSGTGTASWPAPAGGQVLSLMGQTMTAQNGYPLMPKTVTLDGGGQVDTASIAVTFSQAGNYPFEIDYDYWYHSGRHLQVLANGANIPPIPGSVISQAQYRYVYRSIQTGAVSNPSPESTEQTLSVLSNTIQAVGSADPQVGAIDFYRLDSGLLNFTYVGTVTVAYGQPVPPFVDNLLDTDVAANPILEFDNFEPFPSIDLPKAGIVNVNFGVAQWVSGDQFNTRWLPGTIIIVGPANAGIAYTLDKRPTSATHLTATNIESQGGVEVIVPIASGSNLPYAIAEPILAAQRLPYLWGPTDNISFFFGVGDPINPGTLYWSKGNNPDSAPDTNQQNVTSPSEPLINGCIVNGIGLVMSAERGFLIYPNFFNALATVTGTQGSTWTLQESISVRGLYMPRCITVDGGGNVFFRAKDGIMLSRGGQGAISITDDDMYNLFPREGFSPKPVTRGGYTIYPPNDLLPQAQKMNVANGYLYYDYMALVPNPDGGFINTPQTLVFDIAAMGWVVDSYFYPAILHILEEGPNINGTLTGNTDGSVRPLSDSGAELGCAIVLMPSMNAGDTRGQKHFGDLYIEAGPRGS